MPEHVSRERLSALVEDRSPSDRERRHLEGCRECEREMERLRRMRMALSAMDQLEAPDDGWRRLERALPELPEREPDRPSWLAAARPRTWASVAAAAALFVGGLTLGAYLDGRAGGSGPVAANEEAEPVPTSRAGDRSAADGRMASGELLPERGTTRGGEGATDGALAAMEAYRDPTVAAEHLARLDAMLRATREALREDPADPAMNDFLFRVAEDRQELLDALNLATLEYR